MKLFVGRACADATQSLEAQRHGELGQFGRGKRANLLKNLRGGHGGEFDRLGEIGKHKTHLGCLFLSPEIVILPAIGKSHITYISIGHRGEIQRQLLESLRPRRLRIGSTAQVGENAADEIDAGVERGIGR